MAIEAVDTGKKDEDKKDDKKISHDEASHYLVLADGTHVAFSVGDDPYQVMPTEHNGMRVDRVVAAH